MRAGRRSFALVALGLWPVACAVYNDDSLTPSSGDSAAGAALSGSAGSSPNVGQSGSSAAGGSNAGKSSGGTPAAAGTATGGNAEPGGGTSTGDGGDAAGGASEIPKAGSANGGSGGHGGSSGGAGAPSGGVSGTGGGGGKAGGGMGGGGTAGAGGMPTGPLCTDHLLTARSSWVATASHYDVGNSGVPANLLDSAKTRWSTGKAQSGNEWLQIDFGATVTLNHINLQQGDDINDYPRGYSVIVSDTAKDLNGTVKLTGSGKSGVSTAILLPALASGRYLLIKQTGSSLSWWSAEEIEVSCAD